MKIQELIDKRNGLAADLRSMHDTAETEDRAFTPEEREKWDAIEVDMASCDQRIDSAKRAAELKPIDMPVIDMPGGDKPLSADQQRRAVEGDGEKSETYDEVFSHWLRRGMEGMTAKQQALMVEKRAQGITTGGAGGYTVPTDLSRRVIEAMLAYGGIANVANVITTSSGNPIPFPCNDDTGNIGAILAENTVVDEQDTVFTQKQMGAYKYTSKMIRVSLELLQDNEVNLENYLVNILAKRLGRAESAHFCTGDGSAAPEGITVGATLQADAAAIDGVTYADLLGLEHAIDPAYRSQGVGTFVFNDGTFKAIKGLMDLDGRPLWLPSVAGVAPATFLGYGYQIDQGMPAIAADAITIAFGDMSAFTIRRVMSIDIMRLVERYMDYGQHAFLGFSRVDSKLLDVGAVATLLHPSS